MKTETLYSCGGLQDDAARLARLKSASASLAVEDDVHKVNPPGQPMSLPVCLSASQHQKAPACIEFLCPRR